MQFILREERQKYHDLLIKHKGLDANHNSDKVIRILIEYNTILNTISNLNYLIYIVES